MPARTFALLLEAAAAKAAFDKLQRFGAVSLAEALVFGDAEAQRRAQTEVKRLHRLAYGEDP